MPQRDPFPTVFAYHGDDKADGLAVKSFGVHDFHYIAPARHFQVRTHETLHFVLRGAGTLHVGNGTYHVTAGTLFYTPSGVRVMYYPDQNDPWKYVWFDFHEPQPCLLPGVGFDAENPLLATARAQELTALLLGLYGRLKEGGAGTDLYLVSAFYRVLSMIAAERGGEAPDEKQQHVDRALAVIEAEYRDERFSVDALCKAIHVSHPYLCRIFKQRTGKSPMHHLIDLRMNAAVELLTGSALSVKEVAFAVGYADEAHFSKEFKRHYLLAPTAFRRK